MLVLLLQSHPERGDVFFDVGFATTTTSSSSSHITCDKKKGHPKELGGGDIYK